MYLWLSESISNFNIILSLLSCDSVVADTCVSMEEWVAHPTEHTALDDIIPCVEPATANESLYRSRQVTYQLVNLVNQVITNVSNGNFPPQTPFFYFNQSGPLMPTLCNPFTADLNNRTCTRGEVTLDNATRVSFYNQVFRSLKFGELLTAFHLSILIIKCRFGRILSARLPLSQELRYALPWAVLPQRFSVRWQRAWMWARGCISMGPSWSSWRTALSSATPSPTSTRTTALAWRGTANGFTSAWWWFRRPLCSPSSSGWSTPGSGATVRTANSTTTLTSRIRLARTLDAYGRCCAAEESPCPYSSCLSSSCRSPCLLIVRWLHRSCPLLFFSFFFVVALMWIIIVAWSFSSCLLFLVNWNFVKRCCLWTWDRFLTLCH